MPALPTPPDGIDLDFELNLGADGQVHEMETASNDPIRSRISALLKEYKKFAEKHFSTEELPSHDFFLKLDEAATLCGKMPDREPFISYRNLLRRLRAYSSSLPSAWMDLRKARKAGDPSLLEELIDYLDQIDKSLGNDFVEPVIEESFAPLRNMHAKIESVRQRARNALSTLRPTAPAHEEKAHAPVPEPHEDDMPPTTTMAELRSVVADVMSDELNEQINLLELAELPHPQGEAARLLAIRSALEKTQVDPLAKLQPETVLELNGQLGSAIQKRKQLREKLEEYFS
jgi:hypothetical protein